MQRFKTGRVTLSFEEPITEDSKEDPINENPIEDPIISFENLKKTEH